ncbi:hypothetical protein [Corynebacterium sp. CNCTC7651]|uniref:hypothetical protein n=1 Tax=Corynebacterium sp. CNCTC7651 TaxID=2815361 RepID=UPI00351D0097
MLAGEAHEFRQIIGVARLDDDRRDVAVRRGIRREADEIGDAGLDVVWADDLAQLLAQRGVGAVGVLGADGIGFGFGVGGFGDALRIGGEHLSHVPMVRPEEQVS